MPKKLSDILLADGRKQLVIDDCTKVLEANIAARSGLRGMAMRAAIGVAKASRPDLLPGIVDRLLPEFSVALEPLWQGANASKMPFDQYLLAHADDSVEALTGVLTTRALNSPNPMVKSFHARFGDSTGDEFRAALPELARVFAKHAAAG